MLNILRNLLFKRNIKVNGNQNVLIILELKKLIENVDEITVNLTLDGKPFKIIKLRRNV